VSKVIWQKAASPIAATTLIAPRGSECTCLLHAPGRKTVCSTRGGQMQAVITIFKDGRPPSGIFKYRKF